MAKLRPKQLEPSKTGPSKVGFDGEEDGWVLVKKQRVFIVLPSLPLPEQFTMEKPATSQSQAEFREAIADVQETTLVQTVVPSLTPPEQFMLQKPETSQSQAALRDVIVDMHETTPVHTVVPSLPLPEHFVLQKPSHSLAELRDGILDTHKNTSVHTVVPSLPITEQYTLQKPAASQSQAELRDGAHTQKTTPVQTMAPSLPVTEHHNLKKPVTLQSQAELRDGMAHTKKTTPVHTMVPSLPVTEHYNLQKPATLQSQAELRADKLETSLVHTMVPSLPVPERCTLQKPTTSQSRAKQRDFVADAHETTHFHIAEPEACPDFTSVDKPEMVMDHNLTTRKAPAARRSLQDCRMNPDRRPEIQRRRTGHKPIRFPRVLCSSVVMDNEKLRVLNLERKVEKAGGLNKWVGSIGLGTEFEKMLRGQRMSKFQVANLTMEKLKHMGALAVGPRRKLIHAIRCVYHPHCLRASFN
ncbi:unnamed protein product [Arabis nemorensis]|uniref:SAM domain-containing protein n=1 Tax=Arabis nemorensis TaxID=586526 RepID=A0A565B7E9_9BRAS|nr:unnamed protein product [Arabis nemorensis]